MRYVNFSLEWNSFSHIHLMQTLDLWHPSLSFDFITWCTNMAHFCLHVCLRDRIMIIKDIDLCRTSVCHCIIYISVQLDGFGPGMLAIEFLFVWFYSFILELEPLRTDCWIAWFILIGGKTAIHSQSSCSPSAGTALWHGRHFEEPLIGL